MKHTFKLRDPKSDTPTAIYFTVYFKEEMKSLVYPAKVSIHPKDWNQENHLPKNKGLVHHSISQIKTIKKRCNDISSSFDEIEAIYVNLGEKLNSQKAKKELDLKLERLSNSNNDFFDVYDEFLKYKENDFSRKGISDSTLKRYKSYKNLLKAFEKERKSKIALSEINQKFYNDLLKFSIEVKTQSANTLYRNIGLFKTFMRWAFDNEKTRNDEFQKFEKPAKQATTEIALNLDQISEIYNFDFSNNPKLEKVRDVFIIGCLTGQRFSNYTQFKKGDIVNENGDEILLVPDCKDTSKILAIPCLEITKKILEKYDFNLPVISNQKFNQYLKESFKIMGFENNTKKIKRLGKEIIEETMPLYQRISSHVARRTFITIMLNKGVPIKIIMSITGHKSLDNFMLYYKPDDSQKIEGMKEAFKNLTV